MFLCTRDKCCWPCCQHTPINLPVSSTCSTPGEVHAAKASLACKAEEQRRGLDWDAWGPQRLPGRRGCPLLAHPPCPVHNEPPRPRQPAPTNRLDDGQLVERHLLQCARRNIGFQGRRQALQDSHRLHLPTSTVSLSLQPCQPPASALSPPRTQVLTSTVPLPRLGAGPVKPLNPEPDTVETCSQQGQPAGAASRT